MRRSNGKPPPLRHASRRPRLHWRLHCRRRHRPRLVAIGAVVHDNAAATVKLLRHSPLDRVQAPVVMISPSLLPHCVHSLFVYAIDLGTLVLDVKKKEG